MQLFLLELQFLFFSSLHFYAVQHDTAEVQYALHFTFTFCKHRVLSSSSLTKNVATLYVYAYKVK